MPSSPATPTSRNAVAKRARSTATRRSQTTAQEKPAPAHPPFTAASVSWGISASRAADAKAAAAGTWAGRAGLAVEVGAGAEVAALPGQDHQPQAVVGGQVGEGGVHLLRHLRGRGVAPFRAVEAHPCDRVVHGDRQGGVVQRLHNDS